MKKLMNLKGVKTLSKKEQQSIHGGGGTCAAHKPCTLPGSHDDSCGGGDTRYALSRVEAEAFVADGGYWCCDSCGSATWH